MKVGSEPLQVPIRVLVADSNQTQSQLLSSALKRQAIFHVSGCNADLTCCLAALDIFPADVVLIGNGTSSSDTQHELVSSLRRSYPKLAIILLLDSYDRSLVVNALRVGVRGLFCRASQPFRALCKCICAVHSGQFWANTEQMGYVIEALVQSPVLAVTNQRGDVLLTKRESQVVNLVAEGLGNRAIAKELKITENTVKKSLLRIFDKLGISNRVELVLYALTNRENDRRASVHHICPNPSRLPQCKRESERAKQEVVRLDHESCVSSMRVAS